MMRERDAEHTNNILNMDKELFHRLRVLPPSLKLCDAGVFSIYILRVDGFAVMYRIERGLPSGQRMFRMNDEFAQLLGFRNLSYFRTKYRGIQFSRGWLTLRAIGRHMGSIDF